MEGKPGRFLYNNLSNTNGIDRIMPRNIMIGNIMGGGKGITPWLAMKEADTYIKKVNNTAFHSFTFLKYLRFTAMTRNDVHTIFHFGELINRPLNMANSKKKLILTSDDASFDNMFFMI
jgi:hypothetical protein